MAQEDARRDRNYVTTLMAVDLSTGAVPTLLYADEVTHRLLTTSTITGNVSVTNPSGSIIGNGLGIPSHDNGTVAYPLDTREVYTFKNGGTTVATVTIDYTDNTKVAMSAWSIA